MNRSKISLQEKIDLNSHIIRYFPKIDPKPISVVFADGIFQC